MVKVKAKIPKSIKKSLKAEKKPGDRRGKNPRSLQNLKPFKPGQSGNPGGRSKLLSEAYREWLAEEDEHGITNAVHVARAIGLGAKHGLVNNAHEIRAATEGDKLKLTTWQSELVDGLKAGTIQPEEVLAELSEDESRTILIAAGQVIVPGQPPAAEHPSDGAEPDAA